MPVQNGRLILDGHSLSIGDLVQCGRDFSIQVEIPDANWQKMESSYQLCQKWAKEKKVIYGVNTSCGGLVNYILPPERNAEFQSNLVRSISTQVGDFFPDDIVRMTMIARINSLCRGYSGINPKNVKILLEMINRGVCPCIPEKGSLGASGDLGPLGCIACVGIGDWKARYQNQIRSGKEAMELAGIELMQLSAKEGLSLINGTSCMAALGASVVANAVNTIKNSDLMAALSTETLLGRKTPFDLRVHREKYHPGQYATAYNLWKLLQTSKMALDEYEVSRYLTARVTGQDVAQEVDIPVEDAYSIRCTPQIVGPCREAVHFAQEVVTRELNSSNDNPLIFPEYDTFIHNGHFQGQYISFAMDCVTNAMTTLGVISDRRIDRFMDKNHSTGLPPFLCKEDTGVRMGLMGGQFMTTSLVAENRTLCTPASVQSIPSTAGFQDVVSFGLVSARKAANVLKNTNYILAFELLCGAQAADIRDREKLSVAGRILYDATRETIPYLNYDTIIMDYLEALTKRIYQGEFVKRVEEKAGSLMFIDESEGHYE